MPEGAEPIQQPAGGGASPPAPPPPAHAPGAAPAGGAPAGAPTPPPTAPPPQPAPAAQGPRALADGEEPEDGGEYVLKTSDFRRRIDRERKKLLKEHFGTDDEEKVKQTVARNKELQAKAEEQRRAELSEQSRLKEDLDKRNNELTAAQARVKELEDEREIEQEDARIRGTISEFIKPKYVKHAMADFADYLSEKLTPEQQDAMGDEQIKEWFKKYADENPELAAKAGDPPAPQQQIVRTVPAANGHKQPDKPPPLPTGSLQGKTPIPGRPNSMTPEEYRQYKQQRGLS